MSKRDPKVALRHMLDFAREAAHIASGRSRSDLDTDRLFALAIVRLVEITGEAANRVPMEEQSKHPDIPWVDVIAMRNRLIHGYDVLSYDMVWKTVIEDVPPLIKALENILK